MKTIVEFLKTKDIEYDNSDFPEKPTAKNVIDFLERKHFKEIPTPDEDGVYYALKNYIDGCISKQVYAYEYDNYSGDHYIAFHDVGEITEENPVFMFTIGDRDATPECSINWPNKSKDDEEKWENFDDYNKFREIVNAHFKW